MLYYIYIYDISIKGNPREERKHEESRSKKPGKQGSKKAKTQRKQEESEQARKTKNAHKKARQEESKTAI